MSPSRRRSTLLTVKEKNQGRAEEGAFDSGALNRPTRGARAEPTAWREPGRKLGSGDSSKEKNVYRVPGLPDTRKVRRSPRSSGPNRLGKEEINYGEDHYPTLAIRAATGFTSRMHQRVIHCNVGSGGKVCPRKRQEALI